MQQSATAACAAQACDARTDRRAAQRRHARGRRERRAQQREGWLSRLLGWSTIPPNSTTIGERRVTADTVFEAKESDAIGDTGAGAGVSTTAAESAGALRRQEQRQRPQPPKAQAAAPAAAPEPMETLAMAQVEHDEQDEQLPCAEPRVAVAAAPHKRRAVAAGTAVGVAVGVGGKPPAGDDVEIAVAGGGPVATGATDGYQLVISRRRGAGAQRPKAAKEGRVPAGRLRVRKGGKAAAGNRYGVVRERGGGGFWDCAQCGEPAWGGRLCGAGGIACANAEV